MGNVTDLKIKVTELKTFFKSRVNAETVNKQLNALKATVINVVNHVLGAGKGLPVPKQVEQDLS